MFLDIIFLAIISVLRINVLKTQIAGSEEDTKVAMLDMIHSLVVNTETLFQHPTISSQG